MPDEFSVKCPGKTKSFAVSLEKACATYARISATKAGLCVEFATFAELGGFFEDVILGQTRSSELRLQTAPQGRECLWESSLDKIYDIRYILKTCTPRRLNGP